MVVSHPLDAPAGAAEMKPINTAPKDDTVILGYDDYNGYYICMRSVHGDYYIAQPDARIVEPEQWATLPLPEAPQ